jgi:hypothetical protein
MSTTGLLSQTERVVLQSVGASHEGFTAWPLWLQPAAQQPTQPVDVTGPDGAAVRAWLVFYQAFVPVEMVKGSSFMGPGGMPADWPFRESPGAMGRIMLAESRLQPRGQDFLKIIALEEAYRRLTPEVAGTMLSWEPVGEEDDPDALIGWFEDATGERRIVAQVWRDCALYSGLYVLDGERRCLEVWSKDHRQAIATIAQQFDARRRERLAELEQQLAALGAAPPAFSDAPTPEAQSVLQP